MKLVTNCSQKRFTGLSQWILKLKGIIATSLKHLNRYDQVPILTFLTSLKGLPDLS